MGRRIFFLVNFRSYYYYYYCRIMVLFFCLISDFFSLFLRLLFIDTEFRKKNFLLFLLNFRWYYSPKFAQVSDAVEEKNFLSFPGKFGNFPLTWIRNFASHPDFRSGRNPDNFRKNNSWVLLFWIDFVWKICKNY